MMLSRVAERLFWMARYLERTEDTARLTNAFTHMIMDIPASEELQWDQLIHICDAEKEFASRPRSASEQNVLRFILADSNNQSSIINSIRFARENVRTTRDALPSEVWEYMNELHLFAQSNADKSIGRRLRYSFLEEVMCRCQQINGLMLTTLSRDHAYRFTKIGRLLECTDMTTRIIDVGIGIMMNRAASEEEHQLIASAQIWTSLLHALSSIASYREYIGPLVNTSAVVNFVFKEKSHPRSLIYCLRGIQQELIGLNNNTIALNIVEKTIDSLTTLSIQKKSLQDLHLYIDQLQSQLCDINDVISDNWFSKSNPSLLMNEQ